MSGIDGSRDPRSRRYIQTNRDRREPIMRRQPPIIIAKPDRDMDRASISAPKTPERPITQPTIMIRTREGENRATSPNQRPPTVLKKDTESSTPVYQIAAKPTSENLNPPPEMKTSVKLIDDFLQFTDIPVEYLQEQNDFTVIGCLGLQGVGKSTIMSLLATSKPFTHSLIRNSVPFKAQTMEQQESALHCTNGVDLYITSNRVFILDTQPLLSSSIMDRMVQQDNKKYTSTTAEFSSTENAVEIQSLQLAAFILSVCHVVIIVQDYFLDPNLLRFIQSAEMLKPSTPTMSQDEELVEYFPHVMFLHNWAQPSDFSPSSVKEAQKIYYQAFQRSRLQIQSGMGIANGNVSPLLTPETCDGEPFNYFLMPDLSEPTPGHFLGHPGCNKLVDSLRNQLSGVSKQPLTHTVLSEKNWFHYASKVWDGVKKSSFFLEYSRLLP